jgi:uncharacterized short protein YbdD (DUF466 family)
VQLNVNFRHQNELTHLANVFYSPKHGNMTDGKRTSVQAVSLLIGHRENDSHLEQQKDGNRTMNTYWAYLKYCLTSKTVPSNQTGMQDRTARGQAW